MTSDFPIDDETRLRRSMTEDEKIRLRIKNDSTLSNDERIRLVMLSMQLAERPFMPLDEYDRMETE